MSAGTVALYLRVCQPTSGCPPFAVFLTAEKKTMNVLFSRAENNRRSICRIPLRLPIHLFVTNDSDRQYEAMSVNLHHRGAEITTDARISRGSAVCMGLPQDEADRSYPPTPGEVKWVRNTHGQYSYGVSFNEDLRWIFTLSKDTLPVLQSYGDGSVAEFVLNSINDAVFSVNKNRRINSFNRAAENLTGRQRHEVLGKKCQDVFRSGSCEKCILDESIKQGIPIVNQAICITNINGKKIPATINATPLFGPDGEIAGGVQVFRDCNVQVPAVSIQVLGDFCLTMNGHPVYDRLWKGRRSKELLNAIIALGGTKVSLEKLASLLWPDSDGDHALNSLKMALSRLRKIGSDDCSAPSNWLAVKHKRVSLVQSVCRVDALEFRRKMEKISDSQNEKSIQRVLALYTNDFLPNDNTPWTNSFRDHLRKLFIEGVLRLASLKNTKDEVLLAFLEQARHSDPLHEGVYACLMEHYINAGFPAYALDIFHKAERIISQHTGLQPGASLQSLAVQAKKIKP